MTDLLRRHRLLCLLACLAAALVVAGCGSDEEEPPKGEPIPAAQVEALQRQLDSIESRYDVGGGACADITGGADPNTVAVDQILQQIPNAVAADVRSALADSFDRLFSLTDEQCDKEKGQDTATTTTPTETTTTETVTVPTTPTETTTTETTTTPTVPTTPTQPTTPEDEGLGEGEGGEQQGGGFGAEEAP